MKLQHLAIIFVIIILPISLIMGEYIQAQIDTIYLQTTYNKKLQDATYDAIKAFQLNTINNKYSSLSDSKIRDIEASISTFYNSLGTSMGASGYDKDELKEYIPAMVYTMYDGYYIYGKYFNYDSNQYQYGLKPYIYYACRYISGSNDFIVNYTLDNSITVYGWVNHNYVTRSGYVINPKLVTNIEKDANGNVQSLRYDGIEIQKEILIEQLAIVENGNCKIDSYQYVKYNHQKIYKEADKYFTYSNNQKQYLTDEGKVLANNEITPLRYAQKMTGADGNLYNDSAIQYYYSAYEFSKWLSENLGNVKQIHAVDNEGNQITDFATNTADENIFTFSNNNNPLVSGSTFNENRLSVIRRTIETNLASAIANYNAGSGGTYEFQMPKFTEEDWDKILNNISVSVFMQGLPIKAKYYNNYCIITNNKNEEVVTTNSIYLLAENKKGIIEAHLPGCTELIDNEYNIKGAYNVVDFEKQTVILGENNEKDYYPQPYVRCYNCIVNISSTYSLDGIIEGKLKKFNLQTNENEIVGNDITKIRKSYLTALARERYDLYRSNANL